MEEDAVGDEVGELGHRIRRFPMLVVDISTAEPAGPKLGGRVAIRGLDQEPRRRTPMLRASGGTTGRAHAERRLALGGRRRAACRDRGGRRAGGACRDQGGRWAGGACLALLLLRVGCWRRSILGRG